MSKLSVALGEFCFKNIFGIFSLPESRDSRDCLTRDFHANGCEIHTSKSGAAVNLDRQIRRDGTVTADYKAYALSLSEDFHAHSLVSNLQALLFPARRRAPVSNSDELSPPSCCTASSLETPPTQSTPLPSSPPLLNNSLGYVQPIFHSSPPFFLPERDRSFLGY